MDMVKTAWQIIAGVYCLRYALYGKQWGHGGGLYKIIFGIAGLLLLAAIVRNNAWIALSILFIGILPYKQTIIWLSKQIALKGLKDLGRAWGVKPSFDSKNGLFQVRMENPEGGDCRMWAGNVITEARSLHPGVRTTQKYYMLAFVLKLQKPSPFQCSIMKGWSSPKYFEKEWRHTTTMQGGMFALNMGGLLAEGDDTGGKAVELASYASLPDERFGSFTVMGTEEEKFHSVFSGETLEEFFDSAFSTLQYEMNVTPTSVNIYTIYCGGQIQKRNMDFLQKLSVRIESMA